MVSTASVCPSVHLPVHPFVFIIPAIIINRVLLLFAVRTKEKFISLQIHVQIFLRLQY